MAGIWILGIIVFVTLVTLCIVNFIKDGMAYLPMLNDFAQKYECKPLRQQLKVVGKIELDPRDTSRHFNKK